MSQDQQKENKQPFLKNLKYVICIAVIIIIVVVLYIAFKYKALGKRFIFNMLLSLAPMILIMLLFTFIAFMIFHKILCKKKEDNSQEVAQYALADNEINKLVQYFVSRDEKYISSLGNGYIMNYLTSGSLSRGFAVISDKRVYFRGSCFSGQGKSLVKTDEERTVDIKDVTGSGFIYRRYIGILLGLSIALIVLLGGSIFSIAVTVYYQQEAVRYQQWAVYDYHSQQMIEEYKQMAKEQQIEAIPISSLAGLLITFFISCVLVFLHYLKKRKTMFQIQYAGGCIAFNVSYYAKAEIDDFQKQLRRTKDLAEEAASKITITESPVQPPTQNSVPDELRKYADLLKDGLISQEEYDTMKKKILNL